MGLTSFPRAQGLSANATKVPTRVDRDSAVLVVVVLVIVIEKPGEEDRFTRTTTTTTRTEREGHPSR